MKSLFNKKQTAPEPTDHKPEVAACPGCDLLVLVPEIPTGRYLSCSRCGSVIAKTFPNSLNKVFILSLTGLLLYFPAILLPLLTLSTIGFKEKGNVIQTATHLFQNNYYFVSIMVLVTAVVFPFLKLFLPFSISLCLKLKKSPRLIKQSLKLLKHIDEWGMVEVYLLGILITLIKMGDMASITYNTGFFCFCGLVIITMATMVSLDYNLFWHILSDFSKFDLTVTSNPSALKLKKKPGIQLTAINENLARCHDCGLLVRHSGETEGLETICPRCGSIVHSRNPGSISKTWALVITSIILFIPANTLPIMEVSFLGVPDRSTIMDGIIYFFEDGAYGIGLVIFTASILVPLFKMIGLIINLVTIQSGKNYFLKQKTKMFRFIEFIGRWSMLDIFVIALLTVLVDFGFFTSIKTAPAATYFCIVVICTMVAANLFDPRIMWDKCAPITNKTTQLQENYGHTTGT